MEEMDMAKKSRQDELFDLLRARGLRKSVADQVARAVAAGNGTRKNTPKEVQRVVTDLNAGASDPEARATGGSTKRKAAAQKAAATRKREAAKRSASAKK